MWKYGKQMLAAILAVLALSGSAAAGAAELVPVGRTVGIEIQTGQVTVVGFSENVHAAQAAGLQEGDVIESVAGASIHAASDIAPLLSAEPTRVTVLRSGRRQEYYLQPEQHHAQWCLGLLVQDTMTGIGTVTYYDPDTGSFGALGHGVSEKNQKELVPMTHGRLLPSSVISVEKSSKGKPGSLRGALERKTIGSVERNTASGIFGQLELSDCGEAMCVATDAEVQCGEAYILSNVSGREARRYRVQIEQVSPDDPQGRNLLLHVTDEALLQCTGGIVQGMSGSPIVQGGKLIGAVTHVLVDDPTRGYGILMEHMLQAAG